MKTETFETAMNLKSKINALITDLHACKEELIRIDYCMAGTDDFYAAIHEKIWPIVFEEIKKEIERLTKEFNDL